MFPAIASSHMAKKAQLLGIWLRAPCWTWRSARPAPASQWFDAWAPALPLLKLWDRGITLA